VIDKGLIAEQGTHNELLALNGIYHELFEKQKIEQRIEEVK
jgi:ATP-binding cassette subfamily B protein